MAFVSAPKPLQVPFYDSQLMLHPTVSLPRLPCSQAGVRDVGGAEAAQGGVEAAQGGAEAAQEEKKLLREEKK